MIQRILLSALVISCFAACSDDESPSVSNDEKQEVVNNYADIVYANYSDALAAAGDLSDAIDDLVENPTENNLKAAKDAFRPGIRCE